MSDNLMRTIRSVPPVPLSESLAELRDKLCWIDCGSDAEAEVGGSHAETTVSCSPLRIIELQNIRIRMDGNKNHKRPHIHVDYRNEYHTASYAIDNGERIAGELDTKYDKQVRAWIIRCN